MLLPLKSSETRLMTPGVSMLQARVGAPHGFIEHGTC